MELGSRLFPGSASMRVFSGYPAIAIFAKLFFQIGTPALIASIIKREPWSRLLTVHCTHNNYKNIFPNCKAADPVNNIYG